MIRNLYFLDGTLFADGFERIVHGGRGDYVELTQDQIKVPLVSKFGHILPNQISNESFYYYWLIPIGREEKVYWQCNIVRYADYKIGFYYISPKLLKKFHLNAELF